MIRWGLSVYSVTVVFLVEVFAPLAQTPTAFERSTLTILGPFRQLISKILDWAPRQPQL